MLTEGQKNYLEKLSIERAHNPISIRPFDTRIPALAENVINQICEMLPQADVRFMGASALGISGQNDIDIYILCFESNREESASQLSKIFGEIKNKKWNWFRDGIEISVYLSDPEDNKFKEQ